MKQASRQFDNAVKPRREADGGAGGGYQSHEADTGLWRAVQSLTRGPAVSLGIELFGAAFAAAPRLAQGLLIGPSMSSGIWAAASGAVGQVALLDTAANNLANVDTNGFQPDRLVFRRVLNGNMSALDRADPSLEYSVGRTSAPEIRAGRAVPTGRDLDLAITADGQYFAVGTPQGIRYTRAGSTQISPDGTLAMPNGIPYLNQNLRPIVIPPGTGHVRIENTGELTYDGVPSGERISVTEFANPTALQKEGSVLLVPSPEAGAPARVNTPYLQTGALEKGTDNAMRHMSSVVQASRDFEVLSQVIQAFRDVEKSAARDINGS